MYILLIGIKFGVLRFKQYLIIYNIHIIQKQSFVNSFASSSQSIGNPHQKLFSKRDGVIAMTVDHQGKLQSPTLLNTNDLIKTNKEESEQIDKKNIISKSLFIQVLYHKNDIFIINKDQAIEYGIKLNKKLKLQIDYENAIECMKNLFIYKYPLMHNWIFRNPRLHVFELRIDTNNINNETLITLQENKLQKKQKSYKLFHLKTLQQDNVITYSIENGSIQTSFGTIFIFYKDYESNQVICQQVVDSQNESTYATSFIKLIERIQSEEDQIKVVRQKLSTDQIKQLYDQKKLKEVIIQEFNGTISKIESMEIGDGEIIEIKKPKVSIYKILKKYQNNMNIEDILILNQSITQL